MGLYGVMRTSVSGMSAQSNKLSTVAENIQNVNTVGYKRADTQFSSLVLPSTNGAYNSGSVATNVRYAITDPGSTTFTTSKTDLAVNGNGYFLVSDTNGKIMLTRAGSFVKDNAGNLVNTAGYYLMGYSLANGAPTITANGTNGLVKINTTQMSLQATPSTLATVSANLDVNSAVVVPSGPAGPANFTSKSSLITYDNLGRTVQLDIYAYKIAASPPAANDQWQIDVYNNAGSTNNGFPYTAASLLQSKTFTFNGTGGLVVPAPPATNTMNFPIPGGAAFTLDLSQMTQVAAPFSFTANVDGNAASAIESVEIDPQGFVNAIFQNGTRLATYRLPLATVPSPDNLTPQVGNAYLVSATSGNLQIDFPNNSGLGSIESGALEQSNADLASELTSMIEAQRGFTANSKVFQTGDDLLEVLVNLKR
jgi:flagellar hook protein FlgE